MDVFLSTRMIVKSYGPVEAPMVMVKKCTDQMDIFDILRAPTISEDGLQPNSPARLSALLLEGAQHHCVTNCYRAGATCMRAWWWLLLYSAILRSRTDSLRSHVILHEWLAFHSAFLNIHRSDVLTALALLVPRETVAVSAQVLCTPYNHAPCHFMQRHICKVYVCLAVTCHLHFWQNDRDLLHATAVTDTKILMMRLQ